MHIRTSPGCRRQVPKLFFGRRRFQWKLSNLSARMHRIKDLDEQIYSQGCFCKISPTIESLEKSWFVKLLLFYRMQWDVTKAVEKILGRSQSNQSLIGPKLFFDMFRGIAEWRL